MYGLFRKSLFDKNMVNTSISGLIAILYVFKKEKKSFLEENTISISELKKHNTKKDAWVAYKGKVYDITDFIEKHPGGVNKIMLAAGGNIEPFWNMYQQHLTNNIFDILNSYYIGELETLQEEVIYQDLYKNDPKRHPALKIHQNKPFNAEVPMELLRHEWITPNALHYVRNHMPVPKLYENIVLTVDNKEFEINIEEMKKKFESISLYVTLQCGGNRRDEFNKTETVQGIKWKAGVISNSKWTGIPLKTFLESFGVNLEKHKGMHVCFQGADMPFDASLKVEYALDANKQVLIAYKMNDDDILPDHGFPLRLVVPGVVGARSVKWLNKISISSEEAESTWQRGPAYKKYKPHIKDAQQAQAVIDAPSVYEMPVQSIISSVDEGEVLGIAWSGGGKKIIKVEISVDDGKTYIEADLMEGKNQEYGKAWAWTFWEAEIPEGLIYNNVRSRATDEDGNIQPSDIKDIWNFRGILNNSEFIYNIS